jgi:hypothetical protein
MVRFRCVRYSALSEVWDYWRNKVDGEHNRSENGRGAWVALHAHPTHTDIDVANVISVRVVILIVIFV